MHGPGDGAPGRQPHLPRHVGVAGAGERLRVHPAVLAPGQVQEGVAGGQREAGPRRAVMRDTGPVIDMGNCFVNKFINV